MPFKAYIYCTNGEYSPTNCGKKSISDCLILNRNFVNGKVIGEFICDKVDVYEPHVILCAYYETNGAYVKENLRYNHGTCLSYEDMVKYSSGKPLYGLHISDLKIYDKPRELSEFGKVGFGHEVPLKRPCAPWCYVEDLKEKK